MIEIISLENFHSTQSLSTSSFLTPKHSLPTPPLILMAEHSLPTYVLVDQQIDQHADQRITGTLTPTPPCPPPFPTEKANLRPITEVTILSNIPSMTTYSLSTHPIRCFPPSIKLHTLLAKSGHLLMFSMARTSFCTAPHLTFE